ncbi:MAG: hypothetical protein KDA91_25285 [Planctomycetaceae bacterium]|nr:hypothetical protein [Planctomycetaceae bacterium]
MEKPSDTSCQVRFRASRQATVGRTERSEVPAVATANHEGHERHEKKTSDSSAATLSCLSSLSWSHTSASSPVKTDLTPIEHIQVGERVLAESPTGDEDLQFGSDIIPPDWRKLTLEAPKREGKWISSR